MRHAKRTRPSSLVSLAPLVLLALSTACGGGSSSRTLPGGKAAASSSHGEQRPAVEEQFPALRWVPASSNAVLLVPDPLVFDQMLPLLPEALLAQLPQGLRLGDAGLEAGRELVLFGTGEAEATLVAAVGDEQRVDQIIQSLAGPSAGQIDGPDARILHWERAGLRFYALRFRAELFLHSEPASKAPADLWLDELVSTYEGRGWSAQPMAERLVQALPAGEGPRASAVATGEWLVDRVREGGDEGWSLCAQGLIPASSWWVVSAGQRGRQWWATAESDLPGARPAPLADLLGPEPTTGVRSVRSEVGMYLSSAFDLGAVMPRLKERSCWPLYDIIDTSLSGIGFRPPPRSLHLVASNLNPGAMTGKLMVEMATHGPRSLSRLLDQIPGRGFFESGTRIGNERLTKLAVPTVPSLYYSNAGERVLLGTSRSFLEAPLSRPAQPPESAERELAAAGLRPALMPQLRGILRQFLPADRADEIATELARWEEVAFSAHSTPAGLRIELRATPQMR